MTVTPPVVSPPAPSTPAAAGPEAGSTDVPVESLPTWVQEVDGALPVRAQFVLTGNVRDVQLVADAAGVTQRLDILEALWEGLRRSGYRCLLVHDRVDHLRVFPDTPDAVQAAREALGHDGVREVSLTRLGEIIRTVVVRPTVRMGIVLDYAARLAVNPTSLTEEEHAFLVMCEKASHQAKPLFVPDTRQAPLYNPLLWVVSSERDLPAWLLLGNESIKAVPLQLPDLDERDRLAARLIPSMVGAPEATPDVLARARLRFAEQSEGMTLRSMGEISRLAIDRRIPVTAIEDAVRGYRAGMLENPWKRPVLRGRIRDGEADLGEKVFGQQRAIRKVLDILIRSTTGLTAAHSSGHASRPRGILFFAGPTGVGKTELAKAITELVFGNPDAYSRFDMSEFSAEHSEARLIGAPPGYTGHDAGGGLTNAVRAKPFSVVLFDEIEKAHPRILDKFLQILEDGRLTDGSGTTVHFSETLLIFTSNLGIYTTDENGARVLNVAPDTPRAELESRMRKEITDHFTVELNRPELLNRIGDNIVVFDFISPEVGRRLVDHYLQNAVNRVEKELRVHLQLLPEVVEMLKDRATADLAFGGRGIGSVLESTFVNPLARALFARDLNAGESLSVTAIEPLDDTWEVSLA